MSTGNLRFSLIKTMQKEKGKWHLGLLVGERSKPPERDERNRQRLMSFLDVFDSSQPHLAQGDVEKWKKGFGRKSIESKVLARFVEAVSLLADRWITLNLCGLSRHVEMKTSGRSKADVSRTSCKICGEPALIVCVLCDMSICGEHSVPSHTRDGECEHAFVLIVTSGGTRLVTWIRRVMLI